MVSIKKASVATVFAALGASREPGSTAATKHPQLGLDAFSGSCRVGGVPLAVNTPRCAVYFPKAATCIERHSRCQTSIDPEPAPAPRLPQSEELTVAASLLAPLESQQQDGWLQIVAHQDDDLLFMNPGLLRNIESGRGDFVTVYLTAGDAGHPELYWRAREFGVRAAYAQMAGVPDEWTVKPKFINGVHFDQHKLNKQPRIQLLFLHLPDAGNVRCPNGVDHDNLRRLWRGEIDTIRPVSFADAITADEIIGALAQLMHKYRPVRLNLLDCTGNNGNDHADHHDSALFGIAAAKKYGRDVEVALHRGYNIGSLPQNLPPSEVAQQESIFHTYLQYDSALCPPDEKCNIRPWYAAWLARDIKPLIGRFEAGASNCSLLNNDND